MKRSIAIGILSFWVVVSLTGAAFAEEADGVGVRAGIGTDVSLGIAFGAELNYTKMFGINALELGLAVFGGSFEDESEEGNHTYNETTDLLVVGIMANYLLHYSLEKPGPYFLGGFGVGIISVDWKEESSTDTSLGTPLPGGGSSQSEDAQTAGTIITLGIGHRFSQPLDLRGSLVTFFIPGAPGEASNVAPTLTITLGYRF